MNRNEEYTAWLAELECAPLPSGQAVLNRAQTRLRRRQWVTQPILTLAIVFVLFTALVNLSSPVAYACSRVPVLKELAQAVTFSPSLTAAVENDYVQPVEQTQTQGDITATVEYLIVDAKQVNLFYRLESDVYDRLYAEPDITDADGNDLPAFCSYTGSSWGEGGVLRQVTLDFLDEDVPETFCLTLSVAGKATQAEPETAIQEATVLDDAWEETVPETTTPLTFRLTIDPAYTAGSQVISLNQTLELDGQRLTLTDCEIYPTHLRLNLTADEGNTAWLTDLDFYIEGDDGQVFSTIGNGVSATGNPDSPMMDSYRAESPWFYSAEHLTLVITGARFLEKDMDTLTLDLASGTLTPCPEGLTLESVTKTDSGWEFCLSSATIGESFAFLSDITSPQGDSIDRLGWTQTRPDDDDPDAPAIVTQTYRLSDYAYDRVLLCPSATDAWAADTPLTVTLR
jgi:hypothetical protein